MVGVTASRSRQDEARTNAALCTFTGDLHQRDQTDGSCSLARSGEAVAHAIHGPILGVPHATVVTAIKVAGRQTIRGQVSART